MERNFIKLELNFIKVELKTIKLEMNSYKEKFNMLYSINRILFKGICSHDMRNKPVKLLHIPPIYFLYRASAPYMVFVKWYPTSNACYPLFYSVDFVGFYSVT